MSACNSGQAAGYSDDDEDERRYVYDALLLPQTAAPGERLPIVPFSIFIFTFFYFPLLSFILQWTEVQSAK